MQTQLQLNDAEEEMVKEIFDVMNKYRGKTRTFGVNLIHSHFPLEEDEVLYETHDAQQRKITVSPIQVNEFKTIPLATSWYQLNNEVKVAMFCCDTIGPPPPPPPPK